MTPAVTTYVALDEESIIGTYWLKPNQPGLGAHVANAAFMVKPSHFGRGVGRAMGRHALKEAQTAGYAAMQFNLSGMSIPRSLLRHRLCPKALRGAILNPVF